MRRYGILLIIYLLRTIIIVDNNVAQTIPRAPLSEKCAYVMSTISNKKVPELKLESHKVGTLDSLTNLYFHDSLHGWVATDRALYFTRDGAKTWKQVKLTVPSGFKITRIVFVSRSNGWIVLQRFDLDSTKKTLRLICTRDGGETWQLQIKRNGVFGGRISFVRERIGWLVGNIYVSQAFYAPLVLYTSDGGKSWRDISAQLLDLIPSNKVGYRPKITNITAESDKVATISTFNGRIFTTADGGRRWHETESPCVRYASNQAPGSLLGIRGNKRLWMADGADSFEGYWGEVFEQLEGGSWIRHAVPNFALADALYTSETEVFAAGAMIEKEGGLRMGTILYSSNRGNNWSVLYQDNSVFRMRRLMAVDNKHIWAVGDEGCVVYIRVE